MGNNDIFTYEDREKVATVAERIRSALTIKGMKQSDLCRLTKIPKSALSQYISGDYEPKQDRIYLIAKALNVSEAWLMGFDVLMDRRITTTTPSEPNLSEGEQKWLELYNRGSAETWKILIDIIDLFDRIPKDQQRLVLLMLHAALGNQE